MNGLRLHLIRAAQQAAERQQQRSKELVETIADLKDRQAKAEAEFEKARTATDRLDRFDPVIADDDQCPLCWIDHGIRARLKPIPSDTHVDLFRCENCGSEFADE